MKVSVNQCMYNIHWSYTVCCTVWMAMGCGIRKVSEEGR